MATGNTIEVQDKDGWRRTYPVEKNILYIGSMEGNDITLDSWRGAGVTARHLQVIYLPGQRYRLINLSDQEIPLGTSGARNIEPRASADVSHGQQLTLGDFRLTFKTDGRSIGPAGNTTTASLPAAAVGSTIGTEIGSDYIGLSVFLNQTYLSPDSSIDGNITITNNGDRPGVQFKIEVDGLPESCFNVGAGPILFPRAEKSVPLRMYHPQTATPPSGEYPVRIYVTAPEGYPREQAVALVNITLMPFFEHSVQLEQVS
jgi:hypothetical protein